MSEQFKSSIKSIRFVKSLDKSDDNTGLIFIRSSSVVLAMFSRDVVYCFSMLTIYESLCSEITLGILGCLDLIEL